jgi:hypothetical protein
VHCPPQNQGNDKIAYFPHGIFRATKDPEMLAPANFAGQLNIHPSSVLRTGPVVRSVAKNIPLCGPRVDVRMRIVGVEGVLAVLPVS